MHRQPADQRFDGNFWLCTVTLDKSLKIIGQENAYAEAITGAVGGAAGVTHGGDSVHTDCEPNPNVEAFRLALEHSRLP